MIKKMGLITVILIATLDRAAIVSLPDWLFVILLLCGAAGAVIYVLSEDD